jgi:carbon-monoxide dehydrogenase medium subunit
MEQHIANVRIRNIGTLAGNLCFAEPHADPGTLLCAYDAKVTLQNASRHRSLDISDFFVDYYTTALHQDELLTKIEVPKLEESFVGTYMRFCPAERPMATLALLINKKGGVCHDIRLVLGCMGPTPIRIREVEETFKFKPCDEILARSWDMAKQAASVCDPVEDFWGSVEYKRQIVRTLVVRALAQLCDREA